MKFAEEKKFSYNSRRLRRKLRRGGQHCIHRGNRIFMQTVFLKYMFFLPILYFERKFFSCSLKALRRGCNHCIRRVQRNTMRKNKNLILRKTLNFYTILGDCEENIGVVVNTAYSETIGTSCRPFFWNICFFFKFLYFERKFFDFRWKLFGQFVITLFFVSIGTYWGKMKKEFCGRKIIFIPFSETARKTSALWSTRHTVRQWELYADHFSELFVFF